MPREGRPILESGFGGCGNAAMEIDFFSVFGSSCSLSFWDGCRAIDRRGTGTVGVAVRVGNADCGREDDEGARNFEGVVGVEDCDTMEVRVVGAGRLFRTLLFFAGKEGSGAVGGPPVGDGGSDGRGKVEVDIVSILGVCDV